MHHSDFIREEVQHQGWTPGTPEYELRVQWMTQAWSWARARLYTLRMTRPRVGDLLTIGKLVEPHRNGGGFRRVNVRVGTSTCPPYSEVPNRIYRLFEDLLDNNEHELAPIEFYRRFEEIHPFVDGNGRTGKVLLAWLTRNFDDPEFPPDLFGTGIP